MKRSRNLVVALTKVKPFSDTLKWCGCITPSEAVALMDAGAVAEGHYEKFMRGYVAAGYGNPSWFYFVPNKDLLKLLLEK